MLEAARLALCEAGVLDDGAAMPPFAVRMSGNFVFLVHSNRTNFHLVKVGVLTELGREHAGLVAGHAAFPNSVPRPLRLSVHRGFPTLVTTGMRFVPVGTRTLCRPPPEFARALADYFATAARRFATAAVEAHSVRIRNAHQPFDDAVPADSWTDYVGSIASEVDVLPGIAQHGDFYAENLGRRRDGIVILDWEDFGRETLPGTDLAMLLLSVCDWDPSQLAADVRGDGRLAWLLAAGWTACGLPATLFLRLLPAYILLLALMKDAQGYGDAFRQRALGALPAALGVAEAARGKAST